MESKKFVTRGRSLQVGVEDVRRNDSLFTSGGASIHSSSLPLVRRNDPSNLIPCSEDPGDVVVGVISPCEEGQHLQHRFLYQTYLHLTQSR